MRDSLERHGPRALDTVIVSGTSGPDDLLRALDLAQAEVGHDLSLVPLFETIADLRAVGRDRRARCSTTSASARSSSAAAGGSR